MSQYWVLVHMASMRQNEAKKRQTRERSTMKCAYIRFIKKSKNCTGIVKTVCPRLRELATQPRVHIFDRPCEIYVFM